MRGVNKAILIGHLGQEPELRYMQNGTPVCNLSLATSERWKDKNTGEDRERTEWHRVVLYRGLADIAGQYLAKGAPVYIEGRIRTRKWQDQQGQDRYTTEIIGDELQMLGSRNSSGGTTPSRAPSASRDPASKASQEFQAPNGGGGFDDDVPFAPLPCV